MIASLPLAGIWFGAAAATVLTSVGIPRRRRVVAEIPWADVTRVRIQGPKFEIASDLSAPADVVRVEARYSAGARLAASLRERLGDRVEIVGAAPAPPTSAPAPPPGRT